MARKVDITDKLSFEENPSLIIKGEVLKVNADAPTMLKVMGLMSADDPGMDEVLQAYNLMLPESKKKIEKLKIGFKDLVTVIMESIQLITDEVDSPGEQ